MGVAEVLTLMTLHVDLSLSEILESLSFTTYFELSFSQFVILDSCLFRLRSTDAYAFA